MTTLDVGAVLFHKSLATTFPGEPLSATPELEAIYHIQEAQFPPTNQFLSDTSSIDLMMVKSGVCVSP